MNPHYAVARPADLALGFVTVFAQRLYRAMILKKPESQSAYENLEWHKENFLSYATVPTEAFLGNEPSKCAAEKKLEIKISCELIRMERLLPCHFHTESASAVIRMPSPQGILYAIIGYFPELPGQINEGAYMNPGEVFVIPQNVEHGFYLAATPPDGYVEMLVVSTREVTETDTFYTR